MKKLTFFAVFTLLIAANTFAQTGIKFAHGTWKQAVQQAKKEKKLIFLDAYTTWCGPCKMLQANVFPDKELGDFYNQNFINVKMDMESAEGERLAAMYPLRGYPTLFFIDPNNGKVVKELLGYQEINALLKQGKQVAKKKA
ncbi:MAG: thioredoxin family protein [Spirosomataceae bacterium]